jgi:hypothetical protein
VHQDPQTGAESDFFLGTYDPCCTPLGRFRSPVNNLGTFGDPTRNYRAVSRTMCQPAGPNAATTPQLQTRCMMAPPATPDPTAVQANVVLTGNGLTAGKYFLPNFEFIFGENLAFGGPIIPANLQDLPFLFCGSGPLDGPGTISPVVGQLDPAPWALPMADPTFHSTLCPQATAVGTAPGVPVTVPLQPVPAIINAVSASGAVTADGLPHVVTLTVTGSNPNPPPASSILSYSWRTTAAGVTFSCGACPPQPAVAPYSVTATITTTKTGPIDFIVAASNGILPSPAATLTVNVAAANNKPPVVTKQSGIQAGSTVTLSATAKASNGTSPITISFRQTGGPAVGLTVGPTTGLAPNQSANATFVVPVSPTSATFTFVAIATDPSNGLTTTSGTITVKSTPVLLDAVTVTNVTYRAIVSRVGAPAELGKLNITATSNETDLNPIPPGMTMNALISNSTLPANLPGSTALPITVPLVFTAADVPGTLTPTCGPTACWVGNATQVIANTTQTPAVYLAPTQVTVRSSLGGSAGVTQASPVFTIR